VLGVDTNVSDMVDYRPIGQMPSPQDSKQHLVEAALKLFASRGYYHTSIADILRESGCKRGTLYHYFSSKEDLGYAAIDESFRLFVEQGAASRLRTNEHPIDRLHKVLDDLPSAVKLETTGDLTAGVAARMASVHDGFRRRVEARLDRLAAELVEVVRRGVADGQIADSVDPRVLAHMCFIASQGSQFADLLGQRKVIWDDARGWLKDYLNSLRK
jgi:TetR/AcrR family transcriptional repressor of nem operon